MKTGTALITLDQMEPSEAKLLHLEVKNRGRGAITEFIRHETNHSSGQYYYRMRKMGVMPFKAPEKKNVVEFKSRRTEVSSQDRVAQLEKEIAQIKNLLAVVSITPSQRAIKVLSSAEDDLDPRSRKFLGSIIANNFASLSPKQQKWMADLESRYI